VNHTINATPPERLQHYYCETRIGTIGQRRSWAKDLPLKNIFGSFNNSTGTLVTEVNVIISNEEIHATVQIRVLG